MGLRALHPGWPGNIPATLRITPSPCQANLFLQSMFTQAIDGGNVNGKIHQSPSNHLFEPSVGQVFGWMFFGLETSVWVVFNHMILTNMFILCCWKTNPVGLRKKLFFQTPGIGRCFGYNTGKGTARWPSPTFPNLDLSQMTQRTEPMTVCVCVYLISSNSTHRLTMCCSVADIELPFFSKYMKCNLCWERRLDSNYYVHVFHISD